MLQIITDKRYNICVFFTKKSNFRKKYRKKCNIFNFIRLYVLEWKQLLFEFRNEIENHLIDFEKGTQTEKLFARMRSVCRDKVLECFVKRRVKLSLMLMGFLLFLNFNAANVCETI